VDDKRAWAEIDISRLINNVRILKRNIPKHTKLFASVKADAYGHGAIEASKALIENGADYLGVSISEEGIELRNRGIETPILVFSYTPTPLLPKSIENGLTQSIFSAESYYELAKVLQETQIKTGRRAEVHIKIDTGMGRLGFFPNPDTADMICKIMQNPAIDVTGIYTHYATSDEPNTSYMHEQYSQFEYMLRLLKDRKVPVERWIKHAGNSGFMGQSLFQSFKSNNNKSDMFMDMLRFGIMLYGLPPAKNMTSVCKELGLKPVMKLMARISMIKTVPEGTGISYGLTFRCKRETIVATLPIGYADGYNRALSNKGVVIIRGHKCPIIGNICMDQCMVDITDIPNASSIKPGETACLFGEPGLGADDLAEQIGTIAYEVICVIGKRVPRIFVN